MAELLVRTVDGENALRYMTGDVVTVHEDGHVFGRLESLEVWESEGNASEDWPGGFAIVRLPGKSIADAQQYLEEGYIFGVPANGMALRRTHTCDYLSLERRAVGSGRDTLRLKRHITRNPNDADVQAAFRLKSQT